MRAHVIEGLLLVLWSLLVQAQGPDPINDYCRRFGHSAAVVNDRLFFTGGYVNYGGSVTPSPQNVTNTYLLYSDLTKVNNVQFPPTYANLTKPNFVPSTVGGTLWPDTVNKVIYLWGGEYNWTTSPPASQLLWYYDVLYNTWNQTSSPVMGIQSTSFGASAMDQVKGEIGLCCPFPDALR
jgi:hypothetical protein